MFTVIYSHESIKSLKKIPRDYREKIKKLSAKWEVDPFLTDIKKLSGDHKSTHRIRVGDYRIFLRIYLEEKELFIVDIRRRTSRTYRKN